MTKRLIQLPCFSSAKLLHLGLISLGISLVLTLPASAQELHIDSIRLKYEQARLEFEKFEQGHGNFIETPNAKVHYLTWGDPEDLPIMWIHGSFTNAYEIKDLADSIVQEGYYLIAIDYYGHGLTPIPAHEVSLYHVADDILEVLNHENIDQAVIGGWSRGGYIASAFYDAYPERVKALILEDGGTVGINTYYQSLDEMELSELVNELFIDSVAYKKFESEFEVYQEYQDSSDRGVQFELLAWISQDKEGFWTIGPGIEELFHMQDPEQFLTNIKYPSNSPLFARSMAMMEPQFIYRDLNVKLLILDPVSQDDLFPFEKNNQSLRDMHPDLITHNIYDDTGHNIHYEKPERFLRDVLMFLNTIK
ncbi:alpha/beta fold hydrolase [Algoriphagus sp.]|uniref:alpha/beta fold hydrolase n=1 Tax=Algoriphagus sp. TaxID=1872435 RepID=UPI003F7089C6